MSYEKLFFSAGEAERDLLAKLKVERKKGNVLVKYEHVEFPPTYDEAGIVAPDYIRCIVVVKDINLYKWFMANTKRMIELHKQAVLLKIATTGKGTYKKPPRRYPVFLEDVFSLKIVTKQAYTSVSLKKGEQIALVSLKTNWKDDEIKNDSDKMNMMNDFAQRLNSIGIISEVSSGILYASTDDIFRKSGAKSIQVRSPTGTHYKAYVKYNNGRTKTLACGFIYSNKDFYLIEQPEGVRRTKIEEVAKPIEFLSPFAINKSFWIKD